LRLRSLRVDLYAELHHVENGRPADSAPFFARLTRFSFNWRDPPPKNLKSSSSSRHKTRLCEGINKELSLLRPGVFRRRKSADCTVLKLDNPRIGLDRKSGQAFLDHETFTKGHRLDFHSGKTVNSSILRVKTGDSPRTISTGRSPLEKGGRNFIPAT